MKSLSLASLLCVALCSWGMATGATEIGAENDTERSIATALHNDISTLYYYFQAPPDDTEAGTLFTGTFLTLVGEQVLAETDFSFAADGTTGAGVSVVAVPEEVIRQLEASNQGAKARIELQIDGRTAHTLSLGELRRLNRDLIEKDSIESNAGEEALFGSLSFTSGASSSCNASACLTEFQECRADCRNNGDPECRADCGDIYNDCMYCCFDVDSDGVLNCDDNCKTVSNSNQANCDGDYPGDACDPTISDFSPVSGAGPCQVEISSHFGYYRVKLWGVQDVTSGCVSGTCRRQVLVDNFTCSIFSVNHSRECCDDTYGVAFCDTYVGASCNPTCPQ